MVLLVILTAASPISDKFFEIAKNIEIYSNVYKEINTHYVDELDPAKMMKIGVDAMLGALDPYTNYISAADVENFRLSTEGKYEGIGARISRYANTLVIKDLYKDSPAEKAGLKIADEVLSINGQSTQGRDGDKAMRFLRGAPGTDVKIEVVSPGENESRVVTLTREEISVPSVPYSGMVGDNMAYVSLKSFTPGSGNDVLTAFKRLDNEHEVKGFILDLRDNGGGLLSEAVNICNIFIPKGELVVSTKGKVQSRNKSYSTLVAPFDTSRPLTVLINKNSASASEIVSGTIQDYDRGVLIGQLSFGKGLVQNTKEVGYNSRVKITTAKYYIPSGRCIQAVEYANGEPVDLPDSLRAAFTTRSGRTVLDGGGVAPDVKLKPIDDNEMLKFLDRYGLIFNFTTQYLKENPMASIPLDYRFTDFDAFKAYFAQNRSQFKSPVERELIELEEKAVKMETADVISNEIAALKARLADHELVEIESHKEAIDLMIATEIVKRVELDKGRRAYLVNTDPEVHKAIELLNDEVAYNQLLAKK